MPRLRALDFLDDLAMLISIIRAHARHGDWSQTIAALAQLAYDAVADIRGEDNMAGVDRLKMIDGIELLISGLEPALGVADEASELMASLGDLEDNDEVHGAH